MRDVYDYAKFFIKNGADSTPNTIDGNMKLQKLLVLSELVSIAEYGEHLFNDPILAFKNGCVVEKVRLRYKNDYNGLKRDSSAFQPDFSEKEYNVLNLVMAIFGQSSAKELSNINHTFDINRMKEIILAYREASSDVTAREIINGVTFFYDGFALTDEIIEQLENFSLFADEDTYSVYLDAGKLVIY